MRKLAILLALLWAGSALAQDPSKTSYFQLTQTPNYLANGGPGFVQIDVNGHPFIAASVPGSGTVTNSANLANNAMVVGDGGGAGIKTVGGSVGGSFTTGGAISFTGAASGSTFALPAGGPFTFTYPLASSTLASLAGIETFTNKTYSGGVLSGTFSGTPTYSGVPKFTGLSAGTQVACLGLDSGNNIVLLGAGCSAGSGSSTGFGVDGGTNPQTISNPAAGAATINNNAEQVNIASLNAATTLTLPAISAIPSPTTGCIRFHDKGQVGATNTLTIKGGASDGINNGAAAGTIGPFTTPNLFILACVSGANNWNVGPGTIAASSAPSNQFANGVGINGLSYAQPAFTNISGTAAAAQLPAASTSTQGAAKLHNVPVSLGWVATVNPTSAVIAVINQASTISAIIGAVETATGSAATVTVFKAPSGTACGSGTALHSGTFNANGTAATNQTLTVTTSSLSAGDRLCVTTTGTTAWTGGTGIGTITVFLAPS